MGTQALGVLTGVDLSVLNTNVKAEISRRFSSFLDAVCTATKRATFYNTAEDQADAVVKAHKELMKLDRGVYAATLMLPGVTDYSRQVAIAGLLANPIKNDSRSIVTPELEFKMIKWFVENVEPQRALKLFQTFGGVKKDGVRTGQIHNSRTERIILGYYLNAESLPFWCVKYRRKLRNVFRHAWGLRTSTLVFELLKKPDAELTSKEKRILRFRLDRFVDRDRRNLATIHECVRFIFGDEENLTHSKLKQFVKAKTNLSAGKGLPIETLEGLRGRYHKDTATKADVLELAKRGGMSERKKMQVQKQAKAAGVKVAFDPTKQRIVDLYVYAYEQGMTKKIADACDKKAKEIAEKLPLKFDKVAVVVDASGSMFGHKTQKLRPMAVALAVRDVLRYVAVECVVFQSSGRSMKDKTGKLIFPEGDSSVVEALLDAVEAEPDVIFVISDGYENAPAGRFAEVVHLLRKIGNTTPIYQINPVMAAETESVRELSVDVTSLPVSTPDRLGIPMLKAMFSANVEQGVRVLMGMTMPMLENGKEVK